jgi:hypothetical protein
MNLQMKRRKRLRVKLIKLKENKWIQFKVYFNMKQIKLISKLKNSKRKSKAGIMSFSSLKT